LPTSLRREEVSKMAIGSKKELQRITLTPIKKILEIPKLDLTPLKVRVT